MLSDIMYSRLKALDWRLQQVQPGKGGGGLAVWVVD